MKVMDNEENLIDLVEKPSSSRTLVAGEKIADVVFNNGDMLKTYRIEPNTNIPDMPTSLRNLGYYWFFAKISGTISFVYNSGAQLYLVTYLNANLLFKQVQIISVSS